MNSASLGKCQAVNESLEIEQELGEFIAEIYQLALLNDSVDSFRTACYQRLKQWVNFDAGVWVTRRKFYAEFFEAETFTFNLPDSFMENYVQVLTSGLCSHDVVSEWAINHPNQIISREDVFPSPIDYFTSDIYLYHTRKYDLNNFTAAWCYDESTKKSNGFSFYQLNRDEGFSKLEVEILSVVLPHFAQAMSIQLMNRLSLLGKKAKSLAAIFDLQGNVLEATNEFLKVAKPETVFLDQETIHSLSRGKTVTQSFNSGHFFEFNWESTFITASFAANASEYFNLSERQRDVCELLKLGKTDKEIAKALSLSPYTVSNHLKNIYKALNVSNRLDTIALLNSYLIQSNG